LATWKLPLGWRSHHGSNPEALNTQNPLLKTPTYALIPFHPEHTKSGLFSTVKESVFLGPYNCIKAAGNALYLPYPVFK